MPSDDDGAVVTHVVNSGNGSGTKFTDYWTVTERDGTTYYFGRNELPGWASGDQATNSVDSVPVFSAHSGDPCYSLGGLRLVGVHDGLPVEPGLRHRRARQRDGLLLRPGHQRLRARTGTPPARCRTCGTATWTTSTTGSPPGTPMRGTRPDEVVFATGDRCFAGHLRPAELANAANWLDVPYADNCAAGRRAARSTGRRSGRRCGWRRSPPSSGTASRTCTVDSWALARVTSRPTGDGTSPALCLDSITRTGVGHDRGRRSAVTLPAVSSPARTWRNRLNPGNYAGAGPVPDRGHHHRDRAIRSGLLRAAEPVQPGVAADAVGEHLLVLPGVLAAVHPAADAGLVHQVRGRVGHRVRPDRRVAGDLHLLPVRRPGLALRRQRGGGAEVPHLRAVARLPRRQDLHRHRHRPADRVGDHLLPGHVR